MILKLSYERAEEENILNHFTTHFLSSKLKHEFLRLMVALENLPISQRLIWLSLSIVGTMRLRRRTKSTMNSFGPRKVVV